MNMRLSALLATLILFSSCSDIFDVTPYDTAPHDGHRDLNAANIAQWQGDMAGSATPMTIAFTSDPHFYYGDLTDVVEHMNADPSIDAVIVPGDLADQGLLTEFEWYADVMSSLQHPWITLIGNHDHLSNGRLIYERMFGPRNFTVDVREHRFIFFDDTVWESEFPPDVQWLRSALEGAGGRIPVLITHIPTHTDQLEDEFGEEIHALLAEHQVPLVVYGHIHSFSDGYPWNDDVRYVCVPWPRAREYVKLVFGAEIQLERVAL